MDGLGKSLVEDQQTLGYQARNESPNLTRGYLLEIYRFPILFYQNALKKTNILADLHDLM